MNKLSTRKAAKELGISPIALSRYIATGKIPTPEIMNLGGSHIHLWTREEIERVRMLLPKIANGRKTRYQKKQSAAGARPTVKGRAKKQKAKKKSHP